MTQYENHTKPQEQTIDLLVIDLDLSNFKYNSKAKRGSPNFLLALGLCCYTEYWGKLLLGISKDHGKKCFEAFFVRLGIWSYVV